MNETDELKNMDICELLDQLEDQIKYFHYDYSSNEPPSKFSVEAMKEEIIRRLTPKIESDFNDPEDE